jgi:hypothetical protein
MTLVRKIHQRVILHRVDLPTAVEDVDAFEDRRQS